LALRLARLLGCSGLSAGIIDRSACDRCAGMR
jgi:hypothetical protein